MSQYPKEYLIPIDNEPYYQGRISVYLLKSEFYSDVQIIFKDGQKIFQHIGTYFHFESEEDCLNTSMQKLSNFLRGNLLEN